MVQQSVAAPDVGAKSRGIVLHSLAVQFIFIGLHFISRNENHFSHEMKRNAISRNEMKLIMASKLPFLAMN